jgi:8-oxo-dGTP diphosphatase
MKKYVVGFLFTLDCKKVVLIKKNKPEWQKGYLNGIGGKVEEGETSLKAIQREFHEEAGVFIKVWKKFLVLNTTNCKVYFFYARAEIAGEVMSKTDEKVQLYRVSKLNKLKTIPNLQWLIPMCLDAKHIFASAKTSGGM